MECGDLFTVGIGTEGERVGESGGGAGGGATTVRENIKRRRAAESRRVGVPNTREGVAIAM